MARIGIDDMDFGPLMAALERADRLLDSRAWPQHLAERWAEMQERFDLADVALMRGRWVAVPSEALQRMLRLLAACPRRDPRNVAR